MDPRKRHTDPPGSSAWIERYLKPLITLFIFLGFVLGALQTWIATRFVTRDELEKLRISLEHNHADHADDYRSIQNGIDEIREILEDGDLQPPKRPAQDRK